MASCQYCGGAVADNQQECPHCGSALIVPGPASTEPEPVTAEPPYVITAQFHKWLAFSQNIIVILVLAYFLSCLYLMVPTVPLAIFLASHPLRMVLVLCICFPITYYLAVLTILSYYKNQAARNQYVLRSDFLQSMKPSDRRSLNIQNIESIEIKQSQKQARYKVGDLHILDTRKASLMQMKNIGNPDMVYDKIMRHVKKAKEGNKMQ